MRTARVTAASRFATLPIVSRALRPMPCPGLDVAFQCASPPSGTDPFPGHRTFVCGPCRIDRRSWDELCVQVAAEALRVAGALARKTRDVERRRCTSDPIVRTIERHPDAGLTLEALARSVELSPYHFLRLFERVTGVTPHQYVLRTRLRDAATRLTAELSKVLDIALDCGFGDVSNFNRAFRAEFGVATGLPIGHRNGRRVS